MDFLKSLSAFFLSFLLPAEANDLIMRPSCPSSTPTIMLLEFKYVRGYSNTMLHFRRIVKHKRADYSRIGVWLGLHRPFGVGAPGGHFILFLCLSIVFYPRVHG